ncbi:MAG: glycine betaine ABC transporter substrate-binding protein [Bacteroidales bacterium]|nr:glycine betaine ABC transporter substrate-binding protein [Bacteroidales bacterium]MCF8328059.1 glycine betaine ABC transporter substrate-binding protein [Bacteroidales bacterium]
MTNKINKTNSTALFLLIFTGFILNSCNLNPLEEEQERTLNLVYTDWTESVALAHLSSVLLEEKMEYDVSMKLADVESVYKDLAEGKADVFPDAWLPETQKKYYDIYQDRIEQVGIIFPEARTGFVVPEYSKLKTISDLKKYDLPVIGIDSGAGVMHQAVFALETHDLQNKVVDYSENVMLQHLQDSIERRKEIVVTGWKPHWIFARYKVRFLEDPDNLFGAQEKIYALSRKDLYEEHPHAVRFFERMQLSEKQLNQLIYEIRINEDPRAGVKEWIKKNEYIVNQWVKNLKPERMKIM